MVQKQSPPARSQNAKAGKDGNSADSAQKSSPEQGQIANKDLIELFRQMVLIRRFEEKCQEMYTRAKIGGFLHLYVGEEATGVGVVSVLQPQDHIFTHYRDHGHALARGLDPKALMAELFGKETGTGHGLGGSMHFADVSKNFWGGYAIVGSHLMLACGVALAMKMQKKDSVVVVFFGDGATNGGEFYESMNFAQLWKLPVIFLCENNLFAMGTPLEVHSSVTELYRKACAFDMASSQVNGNDVLEVRDAARDAVEHARSGKGPYFLEALTYRFRGHSAQDTQKYRTKEDVEKHRSGDPIEIFRHQLIERQVMSEEQAKQIEAQIDAEVEEAVSFADESPAPGDKWLTEAGVYAKPIDV